MILRGMNAGSAAVGAMSVSHTVCEAASPNRSSISRGDSSERLQSTIICLALPPSEPVPSMATVLATITIAIAQDRNTSVSREKQEQFQLAVECADVGTWEWNCSNDEFVWSERCQQMFGVAKTTQMTRRRFLETIHPDDRERIANTLQESLRHHNTFKAELRCIWPDGNVRSIVATGREARSRQASEPGLVHGVAIDVTDRRQAELAVAESIARFRRLTDALPEKIFTATPDGETDYLNQQWVTYTGLPLHEVLRLGWREFVHPDDLDEKVNRWKQAFKTGTPFEFEHRFRRADGVYRWHLSRAQPDAQIGRDDKHVGWLEHRRR